MEYKVVYTKAFNGLLRGLLQQGQRKVVQAVRAAISEAGMTGSIQSIPRTKHGETRLPNAEKYDLPDAHRLVVQLVDGHAKTRAFLFVGNHDDAQRWLDRHWNYRWVQDKNDGTLEFVQVTQPDDERHVPADRMDLDSPPEILELPLLRGLSDAEWKTLALDAPAREVVESISSSQYERDAEGLLDRLDQLAGYEKASLLFDLVSHAHANEWPEVHRRLSIEDARSVAVPEEALAPAMLSPATSESLVTFDEAEDLDNFFEKHSLADWMLFLHPEQKRVSERDFKGPARLRGVSGSGKTSVLVHRARYLAKKYHQPILLVTLTESMRKLLDHLADELCGVERTLVLTTTMSALARNVVQELHPQFGGFYTLATPQQIETIVGDVAAVLRLHADFERTPLAALNDELLSNFLRDEIAYVSGRLRVPQLDAYLAAHTFQRRGRGLPLNETARAVVLTGIHDYHERLRRDRLLDHEGVVAEALRLLEEDPQQVNRPRAILCDEVQDLSQMELALLGAIPTVTGERVSDAENGLFLAGDGAQTIYKRGFALRSLGIDVTSRSFNLRKNYRNTSQILTAAFALVSAYEFADVDEDNIVKPSAPEFAKRHGSRPLIVRCASLLEEASVVGAAVRSQVAAGQTPGQICIVGPSTRTRDEVRRALDRLGVPHTDLRQDADFESDRVKVSTIESAKGHEFASVFIVGLIEGVLPQAGTPDAEIAREAARLYVAMTRARDSVTLSYSPTGAYEPSRFLLAIQPHCDEARIRDGQPQRL